MAIDVYLSIEGIKGESVDSKNQGWLECLSVHWGLTQPRSATASTAGGHTAERVEMEDVTFTKHVDLSSPILLQTCAMGKTLPKAKFEFFRADGSGDRIKYFEIELENVLVGHVEPDLHPGDILSEHIGLKFSKVTWRYTQQRINGGAGGSTMGSWNLATNRTAWAHTRCVNTEDTMFMSTASRLNMRHREKTMMKYYDDGGPGRGNCTWGIGTKAHTGPCSKEELAREVTESDVEREFSSRLRVAERSVERNIKVELTQAQFDALVSLAYNAGVPGSRKVFDLINTGDFEGAAKRSAA